jgi:hypothetical protein
MTVSAIEATAGGVDKTFRRSESECTISAEGMYAARLVRSGSPSGAAARGGAAHGGEDGPWFPERWTLGGPEPYRVALPAARPEQPGSEVLPMGDGRVLIHRVQGRRHIFALLHPTSPGTREIPLGAVDCPAHPDGSRYAARPHPGHPATTGPATAPDRPAHGHQATGRGHPGRWARLAPQAVRSPDPAGPACPAGAVQEDRPPQEECPAVRLLPPVPGGRRAYALVVGARSTALWLVAGGPSGPRRLAEIPGRCSGGAWLERTGRLLAVDQEHDGRTKTVTVDLGRGCTVSPLLEIAEESTDRLLLADPDSGLLLIRSDAPTPGHERLAWGVLGGTLPVRFPECLRLPDCAITPFAIQPGQVLTPERCAVALRIDGAAGTWLGVWRPAERTLHHAPAPEGWLTGSGVWSREGVLHLPYTTPAVSCGLARLAAPPVRTDPARGPARTGPGPTARPGRAPRTTSATGTTGTTARVLAGAGAVVTPVIAMRGGTGRTAADGHGGMPGTGAAAPDRAATGTPGTATGASGAVAGQPRPRGTATETLSAPTGTPGTATGALGTSAVLCSARVPAAAAARGSAEVRHTASAHDCAGAPVTAHDRTRAPQAAAAPGDATRGHDDTGPVAPAEPDGHGRSAGHCRPAEPSAYGGPGKLLEHGSDEPGMPGPSPAPCEGLAPPRPVPLRDAPLIDRTATDQPRRPAPHG